jgi:chromosome segregation ATPase
MVSNVNELEKNFYKQRERILRALKKEEELLKKEMGGLTTQLAGLRSKQAKVTSMDRTTKRRLGELKARLERMHRQEVSDSASIKFMQKRIRQMRREIPSIERSIRLSVPEIRKLAKTDKRLESMLVPLNKKVAERQKALVDLRAKMKKLYKKEDFIKKGTIVWGEFRKHVKKRPARKQIQKPERKGLFDVFKRK